MSESTDSQPFQAEVQQLLDIVIHSLYTDKEIFVRELVSNASDSLEKLKLTQLTEKAVFQGEEPLEIRISTDEEANTITITDTGMGMSRAELVENLGTIAHSGSKQFMKAMAESDQKEASLIGQFGVGFYSAFMVAERVEVFTHGWRGGDESLVWSSDGKNAYTIEESPDQARGCRIVIHLREDQKEFSDKARIEGILKAYSSFVPFPILLDDERVNTVEALWRKPKNEITDEQYSEFYKFVGRAWDEPRYRMHFSADAPLEINALLFVPQENTELFGMGQMEPGVSLYCKNVLIDDKPEGLLPEWLRFLRGVIDSADLPLNISRESMQDSALVQKLNRVVTKRFLKFLDGEARKEPEAYADFYQKFSRFLKEGIATDHESKESIAKLLRFESSMTEAGELTSLDDYLTRAKDDQEAIYYLIGDSRAAIEAGPYLEAFKARGLEVVYMTEAIDDYVVRGLQSFDEKKLTSADRADLELGDSQQSEEGEALPDERVSALCDFIQNEIGEERLEKVEAGQRLVNSPAAALNPDEFMTAQMRRMMQAMNPDEAPPPPKVRLEINPRHELIKRLDAARENHPELATLVTQQVFENALLAAGLLDDQKSLISRGYEIMAEAMKG